jgi:hypothetical protein
MSRCFFVKFRAPQEKVTSTPPHDIRLFASFESLDRDESGPASCLV